MIPLITKVSDELNLASVRYQERNNRLVDQLKNQGVIHQTTSRIIKSTSGRSAIIYSQPKVHKKGIPNHIHYWYLQLQWVTLVAS